MKKLYIMFNIFLILGNLICSPGVCLANAPGGAIWHDAVSEDTTSESGSSGNISNPSGYAPSGTVLSVEKREADDSNSLWQAVKVKVNEFKGVIDFGSTILTIFGIITSVIITAVNITKLSAVEDLPKKKSKVIKDVGICFICIALFGCIKLISVLLIKAAT